ncbi:MAG TPA: lytic transglycosylase domain-containing protein [Thiohalobacter sp.]|nr:lytic transglycosylase domain-containing protein [Thiohalobacter sp.]
MASLKAVSIPGLILTLAISAQAQAGIQACFRFAAQRYDIDTDLLQAITHVESGGDPAAVNSNADGSRDIGLMQINTRWLEQLAGYGITREDLAEPCTNILVGAWVLAHNFTLYGDSWKAVGAYNAGTARTEQAHRRRLAYARKVFARQRILEQDSIAQSD